MSTTTTTAADDIELTADQFDALIRAFETISENVTEAIAILAAASPVGDTQAAPVHGITVEQVQMPAGRPFRASCLCGWASGIVGARTHAIEAGAEHTRHGAAV